MIDRSSGPKPLNNTHPVDLHIGGQLRARRLSQRMSQADLAKALGITFQQIQKYERGLNRVSGSKLYEAACVLGVPVDYFYQGLPNPVTGSADETVSYQEMERAQQKLVVEVANIGDPDLAEKLAALLRVVNKPREAK